MSNAPITIQADIHAPMEKVWESWTTPHHISNWAMSSDDWEAQAHENDLQEGGKFKTTMSAKDKSASFDFTGVYTTVEQHAVIEYDIDDGRHVKIVFDSIPEGVRVTETFDPENENPPEMQRDGWQAMLDSCKKYTESL